MSGVDTIDGQHKLIIKKIGELLTACKHGAGPEEALEMVVFMRDYCEEHFLWEEEYMVKYNYPHYLSHVRQHRECRKYFENIQEHVEKNGVGPDTVVVVNKKLVAWLLSHIRNTDLKMAEYLRNEM